MIVTLLILNILITYGVSHKASRQLTGWNRISLTNRQKSTTRLRKSTSTSKQEALNMRFDKVPNNKYRYEVGDFVAGRAASWEKEPFWIAKVLLTESNGLPLNPPLFTGTVPRTKMITCSAHYTLYFNDYLLGCVKLQSKRASQVQRWRRPPTTKRILTQ